MNWKSLKEVTSELELHPEDDSPEAILTCLRRELAALHPDKHDGKFATPKAENRWHQLSSAKEYVESATQTQLAMIPINELPALMKSMRDATLEPITVRASRIVAESRSSIKQKTFFPKLTSGIFAGICAFLVAASGTFKDHPFLGHFLLRTSTQVGLLIVMLYAAMFFIFFWMREGRAERYLEWLLTSEGTHEVLARVLADAESTSAGKIFTFGELVDAISGRRRIRGQNRRSDTLAMLVGGRYIDRPLAEKTAQLMLDRLKDEQLISELPRRGLSQRFQVSDEVTKEISASGDDA